MPEEFREHWNAALSIMCKSFNEVAFETWIKTLEPLYIENGSYLLKAKDEFHKDMISQRHLNEIVNSLNAISGNFYDVRLLSPNELKNNELKNNLKDKSELGDDSNQLKINFNSNINSKYTFENFVRGKSNELAYAAAVALSEAPGLTTYNPLFLYGGPGLGKTHLMHSIGNRILKTDAVSKVLYTTSEMFTNEFVRSIIERTNQEFRDKYREIDVLLIDDIQFLSDKEGTQEELFHTFNALYDANKQIVISSDQPPKEIKTIEERLRSRFGCGLIINVTLPDFETRMAIIEKKSDLHRVAIPKDVVNFIAKNIVSNVRDLESAVNKVIMYSKLSNTEITLGFTQNAIKDLINGEVKPEITVELIQDIICRYYNITPSQLCGKRRTQNITYPRQIAMYLCRKLLNTSLPKIGEYFGGRDHSTVIYGCDKITTEIETNQELQELLIYFEKKIKGE